MSQRLRISEIFTSIQGEGLLAGTPSTFVRLSGCNLRCVWCDTPYASWHPDGDFCDVENLVEKVVALGIKHVVLTGGEPMIFDPLVDLSAALAATGHHITVETAGTIFREIECDLMSISPKLSNSTPPEESGWRERHEKMRKNVEVLERLVSRYPYQLKFVVGDRMQEEIEEIEAMLRQVPKVEEERILLMPEGTDAETLKRRLRDLVPFAMARGWRLAPRMHIDLFGNKRGT